MIRHRLVFYFQAIRNFLKENNKFYILDEGKNGNVLCQKNEKELINQLYAYIVKNHTDTPPVSDVVDICKATIELFKCLKVHPSAIEGIVSIRIKIYSFFIKIVQ